MKWIYEKYRLWVINTQTESDLFLWENWKKLFPALDTLIHLTTKQAYIRSFQMPETGSRWLGFGRMRWNEKNNILWTTKYQDPVKRKKDLLFNSTEIWAPDWNSVCDENIPPDVFIQLYHYPEIPEIREGLIIALPRSIYKQNGIKVDTALKLLSKDIPDSTVTTLTRFWKPVWRIGNEIGDMNPQELQKIVHGTSLDSKP